DRRREIVGGLRDPLPHHRMALVVEDLQLVDGRSFPACCGQALAQREDRGEALQHAFRSIDARAAARGDADMADLAGVAEGTPERPAVMDDAEPETHAEIEIAEIGDPATSPVKPLADGGSGGVVVEGDLLASRPLDQRG